MNTQNKSKKIFLLYGIIGLGFFIFLSVVLLSVVKARHLPSLYSKNTSKAQRGSIISADGFHIATTKKLYKAMVNTYYIDPQKKELFIELFSIYSGVDTEHIRKKLRAKDRSVVISYGISEKRAQYLKKLSYELRSNKIFIARKNKRTGRSSVHGLSIVESGESRIYPYGNLFTPIIGYPRKLEEEGYTYVKGIKGLEKRFDDALSPHQDALSQGKRDVNGYIILNKESFTKYHIDGLDLKLNITVGLQIRMEKMLDAMKVELDAKQVMLAVMNSDDGKLITMATSNRYLPKKIRKKDYPSLNSSMTEYSFEPGSVIKPITFALLLDRGLINPYELVNGHNGRFKIGRKVITDEHKFNWLSAENVIVHSSNVGIAQLAQKLSGSEFHNGLYKFGFSQKSTPDMIYEKKGFIPSFSQLENEIYKATASYGYGIHANLMQILRAYSVFNSNGRMIKPQIVDGFIDARGRYTAIENDAPIQVIKSSTANRVKKILIKTVDEGTGKKTRVAGLEVGGKTGTAHKVERGVYVDKYNTAFMGFVNDKKRKYTMGVVVIEPKSSQFASKTAVVVFKKAIDIMIENDYLLPMVKQK